MNLERDDSVGWHATPVENEESIERYGLQDPCISIGFPVFANMLFDMTSGQKLVIYKVNIFGAILYPDDDGPPNFCLRGTVPRDRFEKVAYMVAEDTYEPIKTGR